MKLKKFATALACVLAACSLVACTDKDKQVQLNPYWQENSQAFTNIDETLTYNVTFEANSGLSGMGYTVGYTDGVYTTHLQSAQENGENVYTYTTALTIKVTYTYGSESVTLDDCVTSATKFNETLKPISSAKEIISNSPVNTNGAHNAVADCYASYHYAVSTTYNGKESVSTVTNLETPESPVEVRKETFNATGGNYRYLDNEQLLFALRGVSNSTTSGKFRFYNPFIDELQLVKFSFDEETGAKFDYLDNGTAVSKDITYRPVKLTLDATNPGETQTAWIAKCSNPESNANRNVLLYLETPRSYNLGKLVYKLYSVTR